MIRKALVLAALPIAALAVAADGATDATVPPSTDMDVGTLCKDINASVKKWGWKFSACETVKWKSEGTSVEKRPFMYAEFGDPKSENVTIILSSVHADEVTPLYLGFRLARWLVENEKTLANAHVVLAPLVNPDGLFKKPPTRVNARGVDVNRNFDTKDWKASALKEWSTTLRKNPRRFPGHEPGSEPETKFQVWLIEHFKPKKILTIHAPLNVMDYDGPNTLTLDRFPKDYVQACLALKSKLKATTTGYFPGSLGNYAGAELGIPTITLELPTADFKQADPYWLKFQAGIQSMMEFKVDRG